MVIIKLKYKDGHEAQYFGPFLDRTLAQLWAARKAQIVCNESGSLPSYEVLYLIKVHNTFSGIPSS